MYSEDLSTTELKERLIESDEGYSWSQLEDWSWMELYNEYQMLCTRRRFD